MRWFFRWIILSVTLAGLVPAASAGTDLRLKPDQLSDGIHISGSKRFILEMNQATGESALLIADGVAGVTGWRFSQSTHLQATGGWGEYALDARFDDQDGYNSTRMEVKGTGVTARFDDYAFQAGELHLLSPVIDVRGLDISFLYNKASLRLAAGDTRSEAVIDTFVADGRSGSFVLAYDHVVDGSEHVYVNSVRIDPNRYVLDPVHGYLTLDPPALPGDYIRITYRHTDPGASPQQRTYFSQFQAPVTDRLSLVTGLFLQEPTTVRQESFRAAGAKLAWHGSRAELASELAVGTLGPSGGTNFAVNLDGQWNTEAGTYLTSYRYVGTGFLLSEGVTGHLQARWPLTSHLSTTAGLSLADDADGARAEAFLENRWTTSQGSLDVTFGRSHRKYAAAGTAVDQSVVDLDLHRRWVFSPDTHLETSQRLRITSAAGNLATAATSSARWLNDAGRSVSLVYGTSYSAATGHRTYGQIGFQSDRVDPGLQADIEGRRQDDRLTYGRIVLSTALFDDVRLSSEACWEAATSSDLPTHDIETKVLRTQGERQYGIVHRLTTTGGSDRSQISILTRQESPTHQLELEAGWVREEMNRGPQVDVVMTTKADPWTWSTEGSYGFRSGNETGYHWEVKQALTRVIAPAYEVSVHVGLSRRINLDPPTSGYLAWNTRFDLGITF